MGAFRQADLFDEFGGFHGDDRRRSPARQPSPVGRHQVGAAPLDHEQAAALLEAHDDYRILRRLKPRPVSERRSPAPGERIAIVVDTETTGLDHRRDEIIELGMVACIHDDEGCIVDVIDAFSALREPTIPIGPDVTRLTGITTEMVQGHVIDLEAVERFIADADLVIAHNAGFDRPFCERLVRGFGPKAWACSVREVDWAGHGFEGAKLGYLVGQCGLFHHGHRAVDDCHALLEILGAPLPGNAGRALRHLLLASQRTRLRIWAEGAPFERKDVLKRRGYRWNDGTDGRPKSWWVEVDEDDGSGEIAFLQAEVFPWEASPRVQRITAFERYKAA